MGSGNTAVSSTRVDGGSAVTEVAAEVNSFPRFDVVSGEETDHFYFKLPGMINPITSTSAAAVSPAQKKIMQEWRILEESLPDSIYVRVYESRVDLMRAAIVGAAGTPYHDGLFFFDIFFPPEYPAVPPLVHYKSFGVRINPNLYECGYVCLSLLNTWSGETTELWNPNESTALQVLLSIQALVLNEKPYYNEPYLPTSTNESKKSAAYSENAFILSCKTMAWLLAKPPMGFEPLVAAHFRERAPTILAACKAYYSWQATVGYYGVAEADQPDQQPSAPSRRFTTSMQALYPTLLSAFLKEGATVDDSLKQLEDKRVAPPDCEAAGKKKKKQKVG